MCGRFTLTASGEAVAECFELDEVPEVIPRYNIAPTQSSPVVLADSDGGQRRFERLRWGLVPAWAKDPTIGSRMINARAETVATKPAFRSAFRCRRCLVPADGFFEWQRVEHRRHKQPHYIRLGNGQPFAFAGLWECWEQDGESPLRTFTLITTEPNDLLRTLHNRMPVIIKPGDYTSWLDPGEDRPSALLPMLRAYPSEEMTEHPVAEYVNSPARDDPRCIEPLAAS